MENNQQYTLEELKEFILGNIEHYKDFEEYAKYNNMDVEEFEEAQERGFIQDITCGTYNEATQTFDPWEINEGNLIDTIFQDIQDGDLYEGLEEYSEGTRNIDYILTYTEMYKVFTVGERVFLDLD